MTDQAQNMIHALRKNRQDTLDIEKLVDDRIDDLAKWIAENASECADQAHLNEGAPERAYWHHGYLSALRDLQRLLRGERSSLN